MTKKKAVPTLHLAPLVLRKRRVNWFMEHQIMSSIIALSAVVAASGIIFGALHPVTYAVVGDLPAQSRAEAEADRAAVDARIVQLRNDANKTFTDVTEQLKQLDARQGQSIARGQSVANQLKSLQMFQLKKDISDLQETLRLNPANDSARALLLKNQSDLAMLERGETP